MVPPGNHGGADMAWLYRSRRTGGYSVRWRDPSRRRHSRDLGKVTPEEAERERLRVEVVEERKAPRRSAVPGPEAVERFLGSLKIQGRREQTLAIYRRRLGPLAEAWATIPMRDWTRAMTESYLSGRPWGPRSIQMLLVASRTFIAWALDAGLECGDFVGRLRGPPQSRAEPKTYSADELRRLLDASKGTPVEVVVHLGALAGLAFGDVRTLTWAEVDLEAGFIVRSRRKTGEPMRLPIAPRLAAVLERTKGLPTAPVVPWAHSDRRLYEAVYRVMDAAGVPRGGLHRLRHSLASLAHAQGATIPTVSRLLGHKPGSIVALRYYVHTDDAAVRQAAESIERVIG